MVWAIDETAKKEQEVIGRMIVPCSTSTCTMKKHLMNPFQSLPKLITASVLVKQTENVRTNCGFNSWP